MRGNEVRIAYRLHNLGANEESFLWAMHPLLRLEAGDELELPDSTRELLNSEAWVDDVTSAIPDRNCAKMFARPVVADSWAAIRNAARGDRLERFVWDSAENNTLGLWLTRGGWHGHHPSGRRTDERRWRFTGGHCRAKELRGTVAGKGAVNWQLCLRVGLYEAQL